jgi:putative hemolysin
VLPLIRGRYRAFAAGQGDLARALDLRRRCFRGGMSSDVDRHDGLCHHLLIEDADQNLLACLRWRQFAGGKALTDSYAAQFYDLTPLLGYDQPLIEIGRFCTEPAASDPDLLRLAFACIARWVQAGDVGMLFGCSSFAGADPARHGAALAQLAGFIAPPQRCPARKAAEIALIGAGDQGPASLPPLLQSYLALGGWVSDHAVVDRDLDTLHVFTGVEIAAIPPARARLLRALAAGQEEF